MELESTIDSDSDGIVDATELINGTMSPLSNEADAYAAGLSATTSLPPFSITVANTNDSPRLTAGTESILNPSVIDGLILWLDATNIDGSFNSTITDNVTVNVWVDQSGNGHDATPEQASYAPIFAATGFNGQATIEFDESGLLLPNERDFRLQEMSIFIVGMNDASSAERWGGSFISKESESYGWGIRRFNSKAEGQDEHIGFTVMGTSGDDSKSGHRDIDDLEAVYSFTYSESSNRRLAWVNGIRNILVVETDDSTIDYNSAPVSIGYKDQASSQLNSDNSGWLYGQISEILIFDRQLTDAERIEVNEFLARKWNLQSVVDSDADGVTDEFDGDVGPAPVAYDDADAIFLTTFADEDTEYSYQLPIIEEDTGDNMTFNISNAPSWVTVDETIPQLSGFPTNDDVGSYNDIVITATDQNGVTSTILVSLVVRNANDPPVISGVPSTNVLEDSYYSFTPTVTDDDVIDTHVYEILRLPRWATFNVETGELSGTPENRDVGIKENIIISVTDQGGVKVSLDSFDIEVINTNDAPVVRTLDISEINGLALWVDATNIDGLYNRSIMNGDEVTQWTDLSGNGNHMKDGNPVYNESGLDGLPTIDFDGGESLVSDEFDSSTTINVFAVIKVPETWEHYGYILGTATLMLIGHLGGTIQERP